MDKIKKQKPKALGNKSNLLDLFKRFKEPQKSQKSKKTKYPKTKINKRTNNVFFDNKIKNQLIVMLLLLSIIPIILIGYLNYIYSNKDIKGNIKESNLHLTHALSSQVDDFVSNTGNLIDNLIKNQDFYNMSKTQGEIILSSTTKDIGHVLSIHLFENNGEPFISSIGVNKLSNVSEEEWFKKAQSEERYVSDSYMEGRLPVVVLSMPWKDASGSQRGVVAANINLLGLTDMVGEHKLGDTGIVYIVDRKGTIIAHPDFKEKVTSQYNVIENNIKGGILSLESEDGNSLEYLNDKGEKVIGSFVKLTNTGWGIILEQDKSEIDSVAKNGFNRTLIMSIGLIVIVVIIANFLAKKFSSPIEKLVVAAEKIGSGDLTKKVEVTSKNEIGKLEKTFNSMVESLYTLVESAQEAITGLGKASEELGASTNLTISASGEITGIVEGVASNTERQMMEVEKTTNIIKNIYNLVKDMEEKFSYILKQSNLAFETAQLGSTEINETMNTINSISNKVNTSAKQMNSLIEYTNEINNIVNFINDISKQTNLLALNAAIEAARAGEYGRGFTVVAEEVRTLAEETAKASKNIVEIIEKIKIESDLAVSSMEEGVSEVERGTDKIGKTTVTFEDIMNNTAMVSSTVENFNTVLEELSNSVEDINNAFMEVSEVSQETASGTQTVLASTEEQEAYLQSIQGLTEELKQMSQQLSGIISEFYIE